MRRWLVAAAPAVFVVLWSTGFVGAKYGLPYIEPFTFLALRLAIAAALLGALTLAFRSARPTPRQAVSSSVTGLLLHAGYLGGVFWAISRGVPASVSAAVVSLQPVLVAALAAWLLRERVTAVKWLGLGVGIAGVVMVLAPGLAVAAGAARALPVAGVVALGAALAGGTAGTIYQKRFGDEVPLLGGTTVQYAAAALVLGAGALTTETMAVRWTGELVAAMVYLVLFLSLGAVLLLLLLLRRGSASGVSSLFYLVPPATTLEAYLLFSEDLPLLSLLGIGVTALGVALVLRAPSTRPAVAVEKS